MEPIKETPPPKTQKRGLPKGIGYKAEPRPGKTRANPKATAMQWAGQIVRWTGMDPDVKQIVKRAERKQHAEMLTIPPATGVKNALVAHNSRRARSLKITIHNRKCTAMERKAKEGKLNKEGIAGMMGAKYPPCVIKLGRLRNTGYSGAELRAIRAEKGCGRPVHATV